MLAGILYGERDLRVEAAEQPEPGPGEVLLRVRRVGICGSDVHYYSHGRCGPFIPSQPFILGHEFVATVEQTGPGVDQPIVGDRVVANPTRSCGRCEACISGHGNLCGRVVMLGSGSTTPPTNGAFAEYVVAGAQQCYLLPQSMDDGVGAMMEPLSVALHAIHRAGGVAGASVLVTGGGPIGLLVAAAARTLGARLVVVSEPSASRRNLAEATGVDHVLDPCSTDFNEQAAEVSEGGFEKVFEASGVKAAVQSTMDVVCRGGTIVQIGTVGENHVSLPVNDLMLREVSLLGTFRYANEFPLAIRLAADRRISILSDLITGVHPLQEIQQAMNQACAGESELKVQMTLSE